MSTLYEMGLRGPRCNGCSNRQLQHWLGDRYLVLKRDGWTTVYTKGEQPTEGQGEPYEHMGEPIHFEASFKSIGHSDECYHWKPPQPY